MADSWPHTDAVNMSLSFSSNTSKDLRTYLSYFDNTVLFMFNSIRREKSSSMISQVISICLSDVEIFIQCKNCFYLIVKTFPAPTMTKLALQLLGVPIQSICILVDCE